MDPTVNAETSITLLDVHVFLITLEVLLDAVPNAFPAPSARQVSLASTRNAAILVQASVVLTRDVKQGTTVLSAVADLVKPVILSLNALTFHVSSLLAAFLTQE